MKLVIGLGNPGEQYIKTRHNAGFIAVGAFAKANEAPDWTDKSKFKSLVTEISDANGEKIVLAKPQTFMNLSGGAVQSLKTFYKLSNEDITVVHDEVDLPSGEVRTKTGGSSAGHNGVESVMSHIGEDFHRIRIGIRNELVDRADTSDFVLGRLSEQEITTIEQLDLLSL